MLMPLCIPRRRAVRGPSRHGRVRLDSNVTIAPIVIAIVITTLAVHSVSVTAVRSDAEVQLSKRDFGFGRSSIPSISGVYGKSPHYARDGSDKRTFPIRTSSFANGRS
jgi:hypothetical protein